MQIFGKEYIYQHCVEELKQKREAEAWRNYIADALWVSGNNRKMTKRFSEIVNHQKPRPSESAEDVKKRISNKLNKAVTGGNTE